MAILQLARSTVAVSGPLSQFLEGLASQTRPANLAFLNIGLDLLQVVPCEGLKVKITQGPVGGAGRVVWIAEKVT